MSDDLTQDDIVAYAVAALGGESNFVHSEDVAIKSHELARDKFSWKKYPDRADLEVTQKALRRLRQKKPSLLEGQVREDADKWKLTPIGRKWMHDRGKVIEKMLANYELDKKRLIVQKQLARIYENPLWKQFKNTNEIAPGIVELAELVRVSVDAPKDLWYQKFDRLKAQAETIQHRALQDFLKICRSEYDNEAELS